MTRAGWALKRPQRKLQYVTVPDSEVPLLPAVDGPLWDMKGIGELLLRHAESSTSLAQFVAVHSTPPGASIDVA